MTKTRFIDVARTLLRQSEDHGLTWRDLAWLGSEKVGREIGHGAASAALSKLHKDGDAVRVSRKRNGSKIYLYPDYVGADEEREPYEANRKEVIVLTVWSGKGSPNVSLHTSEQKAFRHARKTFLPSYQGSDWGVMENLSARGYSARVEQMQVS